MALLFPKMQSFPTTFLTSSLGPTAVALHRHPPSTKTSLSLSRSRRWRSKKSRRSSSSHLCTLTKCLAAVVSPPRRWRLCSVISTYANKISDVGDVLLYDSSAFIPTVDLYVLTSEPWRLCKEVAYPYATSPTEFYCFVTWKQRYGGGGDRCHRVARKGTWSAMVCDEKIWNRGVMVGRRAFFSFKVGPPGTAAAATVKRNDLVTTH